MTDISARLLRASGRKVKLVIPPQMNQGYEEFKSVRGSIWSLEGLFDKQSPGERYMGKESLKIFFQTHSSDILWNEWFLSLTEESIARVKEASCDISKIQYVNIGEGLTNFAVYGSDKSKWLSELHQKHM